jgi:cell division protein FtsN
MSDPHDTDSRRSDLPRRLDLEAPSSGGSMWAWLAALVIVLAIIGLAIGYNRTEKASDNQSNAPTTTGAAPSEPRPAPPANAGGNASRPAPAIPAPAAPAPNEGPR